MAWKEIIIGALVTLVVTVISGLLIYYFTQEKSVPKTENLTYMIEKQVVFKGENNQISIGSLKFANIGSLVAKNIVVKFNSKYAKIIEFSVSNKDGANLTKIISDNKHSALLKIKNLIPGETVSITYLLDRESSIDFQMRSEKTLAIEGPVYSVKKEEKSILNNFLGKIIPFLVLLGTVSLLFVKIFVDSLIGRGSTKNNIAFSLLHTGNAKESIPGFKKSISNGEDAVNALSNYAAALAIIGNIDKANKYIKAAIFLAKTKNERAVVEFNNAIIASTLDDFEECYSSLEKALQLSKSEIKFYIKNSEIFNNIPKNNIKLTKLIQKT